MPTIDEIDRRYFGTDHVLVRHFSKTWSHSPRVGGQLRLRNNPYTLVKDQLLGYSRPDRSPALPTSPAGSTGAASTAARNLAYAQAYARLRGRVYKGSGALGVSLAGAKQSREMISKRVTTLNSELSQLTVDALRSKRKGKDASGLILETFFGWQPLYQDIEAAATTVIQKADDVSYVRGYGSSPYRATGVSESSSLLRVTEYRGTRSCSLATTMTISNPNLWLAERAGLLNGAAVAWDLVPWSFMVNAFSNVGSIVNSLTDFAGLRYSAVVQTTKHTYVISSNYSRKREPFTQSSAEWSSYGQSRTIGNSLPSPPLVGRVPELNFQTAAIGISLFVQNAVKLRPLYTLGQMTLRKLRSS